MESEEQGQQEQVVSEEELEEQIELDDGPAETNDKPLRPPTMPKKYTALMPPVALLGSHDCVWVVVARYDDPKPGFSISRGLLLYDESGNVIYYLTAEESISMFAVLIREAHHFLSMCSEEYYIEHAADVALVKLDLWSLIASGQYPGQDVVLRQVRKDTEA